MYRVIVRGGASARVRPCRWAVLFSFATVSLGQSCFEKIYYFVEIVTGKCCRESGGRIFAALLRPMAEHYVLVVFVEFCPRLAFVKSEVKFAPWAKLDDAWGCQAADMLCGACAGARGGGACMMIGSIGCAAGGGGADGVLVVFMRLRSDPKR